MTVVDVAHLVGVGRRVGPEGGTDVAHEGQGPGGPHRPRTSAGSSNGLLKACRWPRGATNIEPGRASSSSPSPPTK